MAFEVDTASQIPPEPQPGMLVIYISLAEPLAVMLSVTVAAVVEAAPLLISKDAVGDVGNVVVVVVVVFEGMVVVVELVDLSAFKASSKSLILPFI